MKSLTRQITVQRAKSLAYQYHLMRESGSKVDLLNAEAVVDYVSRASDVVLEKDVKEDDIMTIMELAAPKIEEERRKAEEERKLSIRNMVELCFQFGLPKEAARDTVIKKYPSIGKDSINSIIAVIYE